MTLAGLACSKTSTLPKTSGPRPKMEPLEEYHYREIQFLNNLDMIAKETISKILWSAIEDYVGLWEVVWEFNTINKSSENNQYLSKKILLYLFKEGLIEFYSSKWGTDEIIKISSDKVIQLLNEEIYWTPPSVGDLCLKVGSTKKGENYYENDKIGDLIEY